MLGWPSIADSYMPCSLQRQEQSHLCRLQAKLSQDDEDPQEVVALDWSTMQKLADEDEEPQQPVVAENGVQEGCTDWKMERGKLVPSDEEETPAQAAQR